MTRTMASRVCCVLLGLGAAAGLNVANWKPPSTDKFSDKKLVVVTGTSSGLGRKTAKALLGTGKYHVVGAVRDLDKMEVVAEIDGFDPESFTPMHVELNDFASVRSFCAELDRFKEGKPLDRLICNAAVYQPSLPYAKWSVDGHEQQMQINYLSHFLMVSLLLSDMTRAPDPRVILVGSVTGNDNTVGGGGVYPIADLKQLEGLKAGAKNPISMFDGYNFIGAKAYKDSKLCLMMLSNLLHDKYHKQTGIAFSSIYPGCIAESPLFREKRAWFRKYFPIFMKYITGGFVGEEEAGMRLFQVSHDPRCSKSGVYWSWNGGPREGRGSEALEKDGQILGGGGAGGGCHTIYENDQSDKVLDAQLAADLFKYSSIATGAEWPAANLAKQASPTLQVVGAVTAFINAKEEAKRMAPRPGMVGGLGGKVAGEALGAGDAAVGNTAGGAEEAFETAAASLPDTETTGRITGRKRAALRRAISFVLRRGQQSSAEAEPSLPSQVLAEAAPVKAEAAEGDALAAAIEERLVSAIGDGMPVLPLESEAVEQAGGEATPRA